jgi:hypothetical protein
MKPPAGETGEVLPCGATANATNGKSVPVPVRELIVDSDELVFGCKLDLDPPA